MSEGCGSGNCQCAGKAQAPVASINGVMLHEAGEQLPVEELRERAWSELLRQEAMLRGVLPRRNELTAPVLTQTEQAAIEGMLDEEIDVPTPDDEACRRYYEANKERFVEGREVHMRHILFAVTDGVDVNKLAVKAEEVLLELMAKDAPAGLFAESAQRYSNCPSGAQGGDLGWLTPHDCAEELVSELFLQKDSSQRVGLRPRLVHSRYGLHIVDVLDRKNGRQLSFDEVRQRIAMQLTQQSRATAMHQYIRLLAAGARIEGVDLQPAETPLVQ